MRGGGGDGTRWIAARMALVALCLAAGFVAVAAKAVKLQVLEQPKLHAFGAGQWDTFIELKPRRGVITDRNGEPLATSVPTDSVAVHPELLAAQPRELRAGIARALALDPGSVEAKLAKGGKFAWLKRRVSPAESAAVKALAPWRHLAGRDRARAMRARGVSLVEESRRYYPAQVAAQLVGLVSDDGDGVEGLERVMDDALQGDAARIKSLRDALGNPVLGEAPVAPVKLEGARVVLTIDGALQHAAEAALARAVAGARAAAGMLVAIDPATGEVLALANAPTFNPNRPGARAPIRNRAVLDTFEPGSTFKIFTVAGALDAGVLRPGDAIDCEDGSYRVGSHRIHDHKALGWATPDRIIATSSNIGAAKIGARLGRERLQKTLLAFGFGEKVGLDLPGEPRGQVPFPRAEVSLATMSFGQGVTASALQITAAAAALANGGMLMKPLLVRRVVDAASGATIEDGVPSPVRRAASRETAATLARWLEGVVTEPDGTGKKARIDGWRVAGKTGTAQKADAVTHRYSVDKRFSSFVGFAPADAPRIAIGVFIDEPRGDVYGGDIAAPVFREVADLALKSLGAPPSEGAEIAAAAPPAQPAAPGASDEGDEVAPPAIEEARALGDGAVAVPALAGLPARLALKALEERDLVGEVQGSGRVTAQIPPAGEVVERGARVRLVLAPRG
ncbi:MAG: penicillin-binding protein [Anaeromyxobacteraceae bacterium]